jgi:hypothetical protein
MIVALRREVVPRLRTRGFRGSFPHFRRRGPERIDLLSFQFDRTGGGFVVEAATCPVSGFVPGWGEIPNKVTAQHVGNRLRLGAVDAGNDHWFRYDAGTPVDTVAKDVLPWLEQAEEWWKAC